MPKQNERERLVDLESRRRKLDDEVEKARRSLRGKYGAIVADLAVETLTEREFRDILVGAIGIGGEAAIAAIRGPSSAPAKRTPPSGQTAPASG